MHAGDCYARELLRQLLSFLEEPVYGIHSLQRIREQAADAEICSMPLDGHRCEIIPRTCSGESLHGFVLQTEALPQMIDFPPIFRNGQMLLLKPVVLVGDHTDISSSWVTVHELCHLLAAGPYETYTDGTIHHTAGLMSYVYTACENGQVKGCSYGDAKQNELFNDLVTWHFMERMFGQEQLPRRKGALCAFREEVRKACGEEAAFCALIGKYFDGVGYWRFQSYPGDDAVESLNGLTALYAVTGNSKIT